MKCFRCEKEIQGRSFLMEYPYDLYETRHRVCGKCANVILRDGWDELDE